MATLIPARLWSSVVVLVTVAGLLAGIVLAPALSRSTATVSPSGAGALGWLLFVATSVHVAATGCLFLFPEVRCIALSGQGNLRWYPAGLVVTAALVSAVISPSRFALPLLAIFAWQFWHYQKQNLGMVALSISTHSLAVLTRDERRAIMAAGAAGVVGLIAHPQLLGLGVNLHLAPMWVVAAGLLLASTCYGLSLLARRPRPDRPYAFSVLYVLSFLSWAPMFIFRSPYAAVGGITIAHGFQYLLMVGVVLAGPSSNSAQLVRVGLAVSLALLAGALLGAASHLHGSPPLLRIFFGAYVGVIMTHFLLDRRLWRFGDPAVRAFLTGRVPYLIPGRVAPAAGGSAAGIG